MPKITIKLQRPHPGQMRVIRERRRFNVVNCGRRFGKTDLGIDRLVGPAVAGYPVAWFSPTYKMLAEAWRAYRRILRPVTKRVNKQERRIELIGGGYIEFWSLDRAATIRGRKYKAVVIDEAAMISGLEQAWQEVIRPTLTDYRGEAWFMSTPAGINFFFTLFSWGQDKSRKYKDWASWQMPTSANPFIDPEEIEAARLELPEAVFEQEYLAHFLQNAGAVFRRIAEGVKALFTTEETLEATKAAHATHRKVIGGDWGQKNDFTVFSVVCADCRHELELERFNQISWSLQRERLATLISKWKVDEALLESNSIGGPNFEALAEEGLPVRAFETTGESKGKLIQSLVLSFERTEHQWLDVPAATLELTAYEQKRNPHTGHVAYSAPSGHHDDTVIARALARKAALEPRKAEQSGVSLW